MPVTLRCPRCGELRFVADDSVDETVPCSGCGVTLKVPRRAVAPVPISVEEVRIQESPYRAPLVESENPFADRAPQPKRIVETENPYQAPALAAMENATPSRLRFVGRIDPRLASRWKRFAGGLLDMVFISSPIVGMRVAIDSGVERSSVAVYSLFGFIAILIIHTVLVSLRGQSLGKLLLGMQIVRTEKDAPPGFVYGILLRSVLPGVLMNVPLIGFLFWFADLMYIFTSERECLHDKFAGTKVLDRGLMALYARRYAEPGENRTIFPWDR